MKNITKYYSNMWTTIVCLDNKSFYSEKNVHFIIWKKKEKWQNIKLYNLNRNANESIGPLSKKNLKHALINM